MDKKVKFIGFRATTALAEAAKRKAKSQHRSLAGYLRFLVEKDILTSGDRNPGFYRPLRVPKIFYSLGRVASLCMPSYPQKAPADCQLSVENSYIISSRMLTTIG